MNTLDSIEAELLALKDKVEKKEILEIASIEFLEDVIEMSNMLSAMLDRYSKEEVDSFVKRFTKETSQDAIDFIEDDYHWTPLAVSKIKEYLKECS